METSYRIELIGLESDSWAIRAVLKDTGQVIGSASISIMPGCSCAAVFFHLSVSASYRRQGVGRAIGARAALLCAEQGISFVLSTVRADNAASRGLCSAAGLTVQNTFKSKHGGNVLLYTRELMRAESPQSAEPAQVEVS